MTNTSQNTNGEITYFNLHTHGVGYLSRIRTVTPKKGEPFLCCTIAALVGPSNQVEYRYFDLKVSGEEAKSLIARCENAVTAEKKVLIGFCIGDEWVDQFTYEKGPKKGQTGHTLKGRLLKVKWIKVDSELVYKTKAQESEEDAVAQQAPHNASALEENTQPQPPQVAQASIAPKAQLPCDANSGNAPF